MGEKNKSDSDSVTLRGRNGAFSKTDTTPIRLKNIWLREERFKGETIGNRAL